MRSRPSSGAPPSPSAPGVEEWIEVSITVPPIAVEQATALLERCTRSGAAITVPFQQGEEFGAATIDPAADARVSCYVPAQAWPSLRPRVVSALAECSWPGRGAAGAPSLHTKALRRRDWENAWQQFAQVLRLGRLVIQPTCRRYRPAADEVVVLVEPGLAFGTGQHESTRMALVALAALVRRGQRVLDFGAGSGILACAAARLGASVVDAVDSDPQAVQASRQNADRNGVGDVVRVWEQDAPKRGSYDVVVANIDAATLSRHAGSLAAATCPGGACILGGIIAAQVARIERALAATPLRVQEIDSDGEWRTIRAARPAHLP